MQGCEAQVRSLGREYPLEEGMETHSRILAWSIPRTEEPGGLQSKGSHRVRYDWSDLALTHMYTHTHMHVFWFFKDYEWIILLFTFSSALPAVLWKVNGSHLDFM